MINRYLGIKQEKQRNKQKANVFLQLAGSTFHNRLSNIQNFQSGKLLNLMFLNNLILNIEVDFFAWNEIIISHWCEFILNITDFKYFSLFQFDLESRSEERCMLSVLGKIEMPISDIKDTALHNLASH